MADDAAPTNSTLAERRAARLGGAAKQVKPADVLDKRLLPGDEDAGAPERRPPAKRTATK